MPGSNYEAQIKKIDREFQEQRLAATKDYLNKKYQLLKNKYR